MRHFVCGEEDSGVGEETGAEEVGESVVFFLEEEDGGVGDAWVGALVMMEWRRLGRERA